MRITNFDSSNGTLKSDYSRNIPSLFNESAIRSILIITALLVLLSAPIMGVQGAGWNYTANLSSSNVNEGFNAYYFSTNSTVSNFKLYYTNDGLISIKSPYNITSGNSSLITFNFNYTFSSIKNFVVNVTFTDGNYTPYDLLYDTPLQDNILFLYDNANLTQANVQSYLNNLINNISLYNGTFYPKHKKDPVPPPYFSYLYDLNNTIRGLNSTWNTLTITQIEDNLSPYLLPNVYTLLPLNNISEGTPDILAVTLADYPSNLNYSIGNNVTTQPSVFYNNTYYNIYPNNNYILSVINNNYGLGEQVDWKIYTDNNNTIFNIVLFFGFLSLLFTYFSYMSNDILIRFGLLMVSSLTAVVSFIISNNYFSKVFSYSSVLNLIPTLILLTYGLATILFVYAAFVIIPGILFYNRFIKKKGKPKKGLIK